MKSVFAMTKNVKSFLAVAKRLETKEAGVPGLALVWGTRGLGKTRTAIWYAAKNSAVYVRAKSLWTPAWMLEELAVELDLVPAKRKKDLFADICNALLEKPRLIIVDEVNLPPVKCLEALRDIHDTTETPMILIGHDGIIPRLKRMGPFFSRFLYITEFKPLDEEDLEEFCKVCVELPVSEAARKAVLKLTGGNFRKTVVVLKGMESRAKTAKAKEITPEFLPREV
jgi:DNA transposition AAA+ family ATPase